MFVNLVLLLARLVGPGLVANGALEAEVVHCLHVSMAGRVGPEEAIAPVAFIIRLVVARRVAVVIPGVPAGREGLGASATGIVAVVPHLGFDIQESRQMRRYVL